MDIASLWILDGDKVAYCSGKKTEGLHRLWRARLKNYEAAPCNDILFALKRSAELLAYQEVRQYFLLKDRPGFKMAAYT